MQSGFDKELIIPGSESEGRVKVDAADSLGYLANKLVPGSNIVLTVNPNYIVVNAEVETAIQDALEDKLFGHTIQNDGTDVPARTALNFVGASVTVVDDAENDRSIVQIDSAEGHVIYVNSDNGLPQRLGLKFVGGRVTTEDDSTGDKTVIRIEGGYTVEFQGVPLTYRSNINFTGDAVLVTDDEANDTTIVNIRKHIIQEEGGGLPPREALNFVGGGIVVTDDAGNNRTVVTLADGVAGGHVIQDDGAILPDRGKLNFVGDGVTLSDDPTGDATVVNVTGGSGNGGSGLTIEYVTAQTVSAVSGKHYVCNGTNTINLPAGTNGYMVGISDGDNTFYNNPLTINANGTNKIGNNLQSSLILDRNNACVVLGFTNGIWVFLSAESFNDTGVGANETHDGNKGDVTVSGGGATWTLNDTAVTPGTYLNPSVTVDSKGRVTAASSKTTIAIVPPTVSDDSSGGYTVSHKWLDTISRKEYTLIDDTVGAAIWRQVGGGEVIELSADVTWYVAPDGDPEADGLTVGTPITLDEAFYRFSNIEATYIADFSITVTLSLANGTYSHRNHCSGNLNSPYPYRIRLTASPWVGINSEPNVTITNFVSFKDVGSVYVENIKFNSEGTRFTDCEWIEIGNVSVAKVTVQGSFSYMYAIGTWICRSARFVFQCSLGAYLELNIDEVRNAGVNINYDEGFVHLLSGGILGIDKAPTITGTFTGKRVGYYDSSVRIDYGSEFIDLLPGDTTQPYPTYLVEPSNTLATTASLSTVATSGSYNDLSNIPSSLVQWVSPPVSASATGTAGDAAYDGSYLYICTATDTWLRVSISTWV